MQLTASDPLHVALFCALLAVFAGSPLRGPAPRLVGAALGAVSSAALCRALGAAELSLLAGGLGGLLAFAGPALGSRPRRRRAFLGQLGGSLHTAVAGARFTGADGRWR